MTTFNFPTLTQNFAPRYTRWRLFGRRLLQPDHRIVAGQQTVQGILSCTARRSTATPLHVIRHETIARQQKLEPFKLPVESIGYGHAGILKLATACGVKPKQEKTSRQAATVQARVQTGRIRPASTIAKPAAMASKARLSCAPLPIPMSWAAQAIRPSTPIKTPHTNSDDTNHPRPIRSQ